jgi:hypothetical protein
MSRIARPARVARIAPRPCEHEIARYLAGFGLIMAAGLGIILPAALAFARM